MAILMQGSDFINITVVPLFDVNQFDLGDVFISPCRAGTYNEARDSYCKDCSVCTASQYEREECIAIRNRVCINCTVCTEREQQICECNQRSQDCVTGDRICLPLPPTSANISFDLSVSVALSPLKERFLQEGLRTGFILFLGDYLQHSPDSIVFMYLIKMGPRQYYTTFIVNDVYSLYTKGQVSRITQSVVQTGLTSTFGIQSNTFSTVSQQRRRAARRLLQQQQSPIILNADRVEAQCISVGACSQFFIMSHPENPCESTCVSLPCPPGYTGLYGLCELCPNATYKSTHGNDSCIPCPQGWGSEQGATNLTQCWPPYTTAPPPVSTPPLQYYTNASTTPPLPTSSALAIVGSLSPSSTRVLPLTSSPVPSYTPAWSYSQSSPPVTTRVSGIPPPALPPTSTGLSTTTAAAEGWPPWWQWNGGWTMPQQVITNNVNTNNHYQIFNVTYVQKFFFPEWNTGHAGTVQYITINEERDEWALTMVGILMVTGLLSIAGIGARLFWVRKRSGPPKAGTIVYEKEDGKKVIPLPIRRPESPPLLPLPPPPSRPDKPDRQEDETPAKRPRPSPGFGPFVPLGPRALAYRRIPTS